jgi:prepilin signal peptidase PulO-like enzyme (type II secretory pathway)
MLNRLFPPSRKPQSWFRHARLIAFSVAGIVTFVAALFVATFTLGWISTTAATFMAFSLMPLLALVAIQAMARMQEFITLRFGGLAIDTWDSEE